MNKGRDVVPIKRRDSLLDAVTTPVYTDAPTPPYLFILENLIYSCYRFAPGAAAPFLPLDVAADASCTAIICIYRNGPGWGPAHATGGFLSVVVDGFPAPDTGQAAWMLGGFITEPAATLQSRYYAPFRPGHSEIRIEGRRVTGDLWSEAGPVCQMVIDLNDGPASENSTGDRYLGRNAAGEETSSIWNVTGPALGAKFTSLTFGEAAPPDWRALAPVHLEWGTLNQNMLINMSFPEPLRGRSAPTSPIALLRALDGMRRAAMVVTRFGQILHLNETARPLVKGTSLAALGRIALTLAKEQSRFLEVLDGQRPSASRAPFILPRADGASPLILQVAPLEPAIAEAGEMLVLLTDPDQRRDPPRADLLQLLGLTPAEARVASLVGSGQTPREAALRLNLSEATVRSTLKVVYSQLGVNRQAELVQLMGRLDPG